jgi:hypothetical protein
MTLKGVILSLQILDRQMEVNKTANGEFDEFTVNNEAIRMKRGKTTLKIPVKVSELLKYESQDV